MSYMENKLVYVIALTVMSSHSVSGHGLTLDNLTSPSLESNIKELTTKMAPLTLQDDGPGPITYADDLMACILTGGGPILMQQLSKLWSASSQLEEPEDPVVSQDASGITFSDVQSTLLSASNEIHASSTTLPLHPPPTMLNNPSTHPSRNWRTQALTHPAASALCRPTPMLYVKAEQSINHIDTNTGLLLQRMCVLLLADLSSDVASSRKQLTEIALELKNLRESLAHVRYGHEDAFKERKVTIVKVFHEIEGKQTMADAILPLAEESLEPLLYTANYIFNQCLDSLNVVAQLITLLGVICNCIAGMSCIMCDMIIAMSTLIVWLTMAANLMEDS
ncbi:uncharacterized protein EV420DRAFT_1643200 [Desarmillaria tabescens]|uniref:Uncharacterized protein n=1 Tax=Armillaria tabescens TaxID=1929756 RepID=A0AA39KBW7_ARMTA|nr:uncharacterized protein EV420DRAFT_1643200 [Desarmillaria tabescens]KAK0458316.1 hypothetical protein EV420DRAFT_1643200 [Desarmillaria tabescens]